MISQHLQPKSLSSGVDEEVGSLMFVRVWD